MNPHERISTIEVHFRTHLIDPFAAIVTFDEALWDTLQFDRVSMAVGWAAFQSPIAEQVTMQGLFPEDLAHFAKPSPLSYCPARITATTTHLDDLHLHRYLHSVTGYAHAVWALRSVADVEERARLADSTFYDRDPVGWRLLVEVAANAMARTG